MTDRASRERIGICGGTFDPFHRGHVEPVRAVFDALEWTRVVYIPANVQPFKAGLETSSPFHRHAMTVLGTIEDSRFDVSIMELERGSVSYTVDTLRDIRDEHAEGTLDWIIGDDNLETLHAWKDLERIFELANFVVLARIGSEERLAADLRKRVRGAHERGSAGSIVFAGNEALSISSTMIRALVSAGESADDYLQPGVSAYVERNRLYRMTNDE